MPGEQHHTLIKSITNHTPILRRGSYWVFHYPLCFTKWDRIGPSSTRQRWYFSLQTNTVYLSSRSIRIWPFEVNFWSNYDSISLVLNATFFERDPLVILELPWLLSFHAISVPVLFFLHFRVSLSTELSSVGWYQDLVWLVCRGPSSL